MTPYTIIDKLFGPYTFSETSRETLADKMDYYFQDHSFMPLFVQVRRELRPVRRTISFVCTLRRRTT
jgi:hypothetical protein